MVDIYLDILDYLGSEMDEADVIAEFSGKTEAEILAVLNEWFPGEDNEKLAKNIAEWLNNR